ncbi:D-ribose pyranase [Zhihengliuella sp.]|uniref:D-ribose pyranase n=1 Tax=Zhihengliuella sp. TaxID=1954483 RepID=UPI002811ABC6|nr:D-ribose pyranase [Zhihengliuella sp.]
MLKSGLLNPHLLHALGTLGHTDTMVIADCGLPLPRTATVVDLSLVPGLPTFASVLDALAKALVVEGVTMASEARGQQPEAQVREHYADVEFVSHEELKARLPEAKVIVRTGETTPYANVILRSGVGF